MTKKQNFEKINIFLKKLLQNQKQCGIIYGVWKCSGTPSQVPSTLTYFEEREMKHNAEYQKRKEACKGYCSKNSS